MSALALRSDMHLDVPLSVMDVSLPVDHRALMPLLLDPSSVCTAAPHALPSCARVVSDFLTAIGHAVCTSPLLAECVPFVPSAAARGRCSYEYGLLQRGAGSTQDSENHRVRKTTCTGRRGHECRHHRHAPSQNVRTDGPKKKDRTSQTAHKTPYTTSRRPASPPTRPPQPPAPANPAGARAPKPLNTPSRRPSSLPIRPPQPPAPATPAGTRGHRLARPAKGVRAARARCPLPTSRPSPAARSR